MSLVRITCGTAILLAAYSSALGQPSLVDTSAPPAVVTITPLIATNTFGVGITNAVDGGTNAPGTNVVAEPDVSGPQTTNGTFLIRRDGQLTNALTVYYNIGGTAVNGTDYQTITNNVTIPADSESATVTIDPILTNAVPVAFNSTVALELTPPLTEPAAYSIGSPSNAVVSLGDVLASKTNEFTQVEILAPRDRAVFPEGSDILLAALATSSVVLTNGDGTVTNADGTVTSAEGTVTNADGTISTNNQPLFVTDNLSVTNVEFFANTTSLGPAVPVFLAGEEEGGADLFGGGTLYALEWLAVPAGDYSITAVATDATGALTISAPVRIAVRPRGPGL